MKNISIQDRAKGALVGAFIGDALGLGPHWYYDLEEQYKDYGEWIDDYTTPKDGRYHAGLKAGDNSQAGYILELLTKSIIENNGYNNDDFTKRLDEDLFPKMDGTPNSGPGGYTSQSIRASYDQRVKGNYSWDEIGTLADTTEAIERVIAIAIYYAKDPKEMAENVWRNTNVTQIDATVGSITVAFSAILSQLIMGEPFDSKLSSKLMDMVKDKKLPFHAVTSDNFTPPKVGVKEPSRKGVFSSPDALLTPMFITQAVEDETIKIEPAWKASLVYGMPCAIYHIVPAVYFLTARYKDDFESAVLHAINGGGQNMARAMLTGALVGAQVGLQGIPKKFIEGLSRKDEILKLAENLVKNL